MNMNWTVVTRMTMVSEWGKSHRGGRVLPKDVGPYSAAEFVYS